MESTRLFDPATYAHGVPYELIAEMRAAAPVQWVEEPSVMGWEEGPGYWAVLTHELVNRVLRDPRLFLRIKELHKSETPALMTCCGSFNE